MNYFLLVNVLESRNEVIHEQPDFLALETPLFSHSFEEFSPVEDV